MSNILEDSIYILSEKVDASNIELIKHELLNFIEKNNIVTLDGSIVEEIDGFGLQLLLAAHKFCFTRSKPFFLIGASNRLRTVLELTGFLDLIEEDY
ncbi:MAG: STAS domain-containing protein [Deltaproteobacteria bacterium]